VAILAVFETLGERTLIRIDTVKDFIAELGFLDEGTVDAVVTEFADVVIEVVLAKIAIDAHVGIFETHAVRPIGRVLAFDIPEREHGNILPKLRELFEEGTRKIERTSILQWIPAVPPPILLIVNFVRLVASIERYDVFPGETTFSLVERPLVAERLSSLHPAGGTESRWWNSVSDIVDRR
jgi:hypothetical protein